jgi:glutamine cyclotransferase
MRIYFAGLLIVLTLACDNQPETPNTNSIAPKQANSNEKKSDPSVPVYTYEIVNTYKHDSKAFTQGLVFHNGFLYESTGERGESSLRKVELESGKVLQKYDLDDRFFGEGMTIFGDKIYQLTWQHGRAFIYNLNDFKVLKEFGYQGEGWGLTNDAANLIMSDGTHILKFIDPETFNVVRKTAVLQENGNPLFLLNELEYVKGEIWANIWHSEETQTQTTQGLLPNIGKPNYIARINPETGKVVGWIDLANISPGDYDDGENTLNGIAYDAAADRIFVTGKNWKNLFEIKLTPK